jgi:MoaA/NifB/PqqE/SkfB family radical SAM enzyme
MEPAERIARFNHNRALGWSEPYREYRQNWSNWPQNRYLSTYPLQIDAELSNICNLACPMCFRRKETYNENKHAGLMEFELFKKIVDEISGHVPALRLSLRGESMLHPRFVDCVRYAKAKEIPEISFLTNASQLTADLFEELLAAGADWITISIDGLDEKYEEIRKPLKFEKTLQRIKDIHRIKKLHRALRPVIKIQSIWPAIRDNPQRFYDTFAAYVDLIAFNPLIDYLDRDSDHLIEYVDNFYCPQHYQRLIVGADGIAMMCTNDEENSQYIGDAKNESIASIWRGQRLNTIRSLHRQKDGFKALSVCQSCFLPRKTESVETAIINGRQICIENYTNRSQMIGE